MSPKRVILGDDTVLDGVDNGQVLVDTTVKGRVKTITIKDVLHVPKLKANLLSVRHLVEKHLGVEFSDTENFVLSPSRDKVAIIKELNGLYYIEFLKVHTNDQRRWCNQAYKTTIWSCASLTGPFEHQECKNSLWHDKRHGPTLVVCGSFFIHL
jgi:hypothetical protein